MYARFSFLSLEDITWQCTVHMAVALFCLSMIMFCINYFSVSYQCVSQFSSSLLNGEASPYSTTTIIRDGCAESNVQCRAELFGIVEKKRKKVDKHTLKMYNKNVTWSFSFMCEKKAIHLWKSPIHMGHCFLFNMLKSYLRVEKNDMQSKC